jgi:hypothetical protein
VITARYYIAVSILDTMYRRLASEKGATSDSILRDIEVMIFMSLLAATNISDH